MVSESVELRFFIDSNPYALRVSPHVPAVGDEVRFKGVVYVITRRVWIYDGPDPLVAFDMKEVTDSGSYVK
jgi:hypothetical protein